MKKTTNIAILATAALLTLSVIAGCDNDNDHSVAPSGNWVSEQSDTISFLESGLVEYKNHNPYYSRLYDCYIKEKDSISLFPSHSSNLNDWKSYFIKWETKQGIDQFTISGFNGIDKAVYKRIK